MAYIQVGGWTVSGTFGNGSACDDDDGKGIIEVEPCHFSCSGRDEIYGTSQVGGVLAWIEPQILGMLSSLLFSPHRPSNSPTRNSLSNCPTSPPRPTPYKYPSSQQRGEIEELRN